MSDAFFAEFAFKDEAAASPVIAKKKAAAKATMDDVQQSSKAALDNTDKATKMLSKAKVRNRGGDREGVALEKIIPFVDYKAPSNGCRERWAQICDAHFTASKDCFCYQELPLRLLFLGLNPSEGAWESGLSYGNPSNLFWRILVETGLVRLSTAQKRAVDAKFCDALTVIQNTLPGREYRYGFSDLGCREAGNDAAEYTTTLLGDVWYPDFCKRALAHVHRVRNSHPATTTKRTKEDVDDSNVKDRGKRLRPSSTDAEDDSGATNAGASTKMSPSSKKMKTTNGCTFSTMSPWSKKLKSGGASQGVPKTPLSDGKAKSGKLLFADVVDVEDCDPRARKALKASDFENYTGPTLVAFTGKKQFLALLESAGEPSSKKKFEYGLQKGIKLLNWPFPNCEFWALPSTSGRAVLTKEQRFGPYRELSKRLAELG